MPLKEKNQSDTSRPEFRSRVSFSIRSPLYLSEFSGNHNSLGKVPDPFKEREAEGTYVVVSF